MRTETAQRVANNLAALRGRISLRELSARLGALGRPLLPSGVLGIERGTRRADVDDLVAIAAALNVSPNRLLLPDTVPDNQMPPGATSESVEITPNLTVQAQAAWRWACGEAPLPPQSWEPPSDWMARLRDFRRVNRPFADVADAAPVIGYRYIAPDGQEFLLHPSDVTTIRAFL